ncbi:Rox3-domain-containing protein [Lojkania enalia]|uniref:Mediator of RNA polymerase II transcription subunit 19 n=1 Tax=Lojkania enalia TaxID=147567 RepID=A0A9P4KII0_9PLEO|nr:Rox3-domain-containing protein [Didymosphaeria enalia]
MSDPASKRQRLTGSFSPASPPYHQQQHAKPTDQTKPAIFHPNTPTSPPYMSTNSRPNGGPAMTATAPSSEITPPSSVGMSQHTSQPVVSASNPHPFPTPASTTGGLYFSNLDNDGDAMMADSQDNGFEAASSSEHRRTNHNRQEGASGSTLFRLCQSTHEVSRPHGSQNLFELYSLNDLAKSVARTDPVTGEKINKLRKSYEGHIKNMQIAGKPKAVKMEGKFTGLLSVPEEDYRAQRVSGKEIEKALDSSGSGLSPAFDSLLNSAFAGMAPGPLPQAESQRYRAYLGTDEASKSKAGVEVLNPVRSVPTPTSTGSLSQGSRVARPERTGSKRSYNESSFAGYGEGFTDDYTGNSTGGEDDSQGGMSKKRRLGFERTSHQVEVGGVRR